MKNPPPAGEGVQLIHIYGWWHSDVCLWMMIYGWWYTHNDVRMMIYLCRVQLTASRNEWIYGDVCQCYEEDFRMIWGFGLRRLQLIGEASHLYIWGLIWAFQMPINPCMCRLPWWHPWKDQGTHSEGKMKQRGRSWIWRARNKMPLLMIFVLFYIVLKWKPLYFAKYVFLEWDCWSKIVIQGGMKQTLQYCCQSEARALERYFGHIYMRVPFCTR